jgi:hypothetical protein
VDLSAGDEKCCRSLGLGYAGIGRRDVDVSTRGDDFILTVDESGRATRSARFPVPLLHPEAQLVEEMLEGASTDSEGLA